MRAGTRRAFWLFVIAAATWAFLEDRDWTLPIASRYEIAPDVMSAEKGLAYLAPLPVADLRDAKALLLEGRVEPTHPLRFLEGPLGWTRLQHYLDAFIGLRFPSLRSRVAWTALGPADQLHDDIRRQGGGRFSVWKGHLYFSPSDATDPRYNSRLYRLDVHPGVPPSVRSVIKGATWLLGAWLALALLGAIFRRSAFLRNHAPGIAITVVLILVIAAAAELYLRTRVAFQEAAAINVEDPVAGVIFKPNQQVRHTNHVDYWTEDRTNSLGFIDREPAIPKPAGTFRILLIGDSFVEAVQVPTPKKLQVLLEQRLRAALPGRAIDVVAMGYSGTGQAAQLSFYEAFGKRLAPDLVILLVVQNDFENNSPILESVRNGWHPYHSPRLFFEVSPAAPDFRRIEIDPKWREHWLLAPGADHVHDEATRLRILRRDAAFRSLLTGWKHPDDLDIDNMFCAEQMPPVFHEADAITGHAFRTFAEAGRRDGFKLLPVATDMVTTTCQDAEKKREGIARRASSGRILARFRGAASSAGMDLLDLYPHFQAKGGYSMTRYRFDLHWNETGHAWASEAIAGHLVRNPSLLKAK